MILSDNKCTKVILKVEYMESLKVSIFCFLGEDAITIERGGLGRNLMVSIF